MQRVLRNKSEQRETTTKKKDALMNIGPRKKKSPKDGGTWREHRMGVVFKKECQ